MLFVVKRVKALRFPDLAITRGVNVFANSVEDQLAHLVAQFAVLASVFDDQNKVTLGFEKLMEPSSICMLVSVRITESNPYFPTVLKVL